MRLKVDIDKITNMIINDFKTFSSYISKCIFIIIQPPNSFYLLFNFLPLSSKMISAESATSLLCVTTITHLFLSLANVFNILIISPAVTLS